MLSSLSRSRFFILTGFAVSLVVARAQTATLTIDAMQSVRTVDERVFGLNAVMWDGYTATPSTISLISAAGVRTIRIPGGSASDEYHWRTNKSMDYAWSWAAGFDSFAKLITGLNAQTFVTVNYGTGTPEEAAAWVAYANASTSSVVAIGTDSKGYNWQTAGYWSTLRNSAKLATDDGMNFLRASQATPYALKYWEIGNECYGTWESDSQAVTHDPYTYAVRAKDYITKMKAVDPTIKIGVVAVTTEDANANNTSHPATNPRTGVAHNGWTPVMLATLKSLGVTPDFVIYHRYEQAPASDSPANPEGDAKLLQSALTWPADAASLRQMLTDYLGTTAAANVELCVTENNSVYANPGKQTTSLVNGLFLADSIGNVLQTEFNALCWWDLRNGTPTTTTTVNGVTTTTITGNQSASLYGWRNYGDYGIISTPLTGAATTYYEPYPTYYVMKLISSFARNGDTVVKATSSSTLLSVYAAKATDGTLRLLVINKDPANAYTGTISLTGFTPSASASLYSFGKTQDTAAQTGSTAIAVSTLSIPGSSFSTTFSSYSASVISLAQGSSSSSSGGGSSSSGGTSGGGGGGGAMSEWFLGLVCLASMARLIRRR